ncbi:patatin-like phospholipase family protein [Aspergillus saccharolyticus JOP 1030-1]|uniref:FabD/lysophospholipase-like protein n=1 Tax=Aspergillus saccharolyticus JOP 1030-1 TaxID=1450539 RepID=A0A318YYP8_9EURO|nr:FabD/lysophospholipase-like protein [Aspergillus saccharolyticus JOP 1030-1]PYH40085.1 FabD/lysophospholipase-like protein [Aspergillus saccharolyticus JOP 1030-1]
MISHCVLCQTPGHSLVRIMPPTASVRALTIDGGGVRGIIPLRFLAKMQDILGSACPVQDLFDVAFGTSAGGLVVLKVFYQRRPVSECEEKLNNLMVQFFANHPPPRTIWSKLIRSIRCWWLDGWYDADFWNELLREEFGSDNCLFDAQPVSGIKLAVTTVAERPMLLTNYRRVTENSLESGHYHVYEAPDRKSEPRLWQWATSAAPIFFPPISIPGVGICEDGGLKHNNPALICRAETQLMWTTSPVPGTLVSLGTGKTAGQLRRSRPRGFAFRLYDSFLASMDAEQAWDDLLGQLDQLDRRNYYRLNVTFPNREPLLNAVTQVEWMQRLADDSAKVHVPNVLSSLLIACLFFELSSPPQLVDGRYHCHGVIRCRLRGKQWIETFGRLHPEASAYLLGKSQLDASPFNDAICTSCARYCVPIRFILNSLDSTIVLSLDLGENQVRHFGGSPLSLRHIVQRLGLDLIGCSRLAKFPARSECRACDLRIHRKAAPGSQRSSYKKRVRFI